METGMALDDVIQMAVKKTNEYNLPRRRNFYGLAKFKDGEGVDALSLGTHTLVGFTCASDAIQYRKEKHLGVEYTPMLFKMDAVRQHSNIKFVKEDIIIRVLSE